MTEENKNINNEEPKLLTCYSLIALKYDSEKFIHYFEKSLEDIITKTNIDEDLLNTSIELSNKTFGRQYFDWALSNKEYSYILATKQTYMNTNFAYAKKCYDNLIYNNF